MINNQGVALRKESLIKKQEIKTAIIGNIFIWSLVFFAGWIECL